MAGRKLSIGAVDIGGTKIATGLVNPSGRLIYRAQVETSRAGGEEAAEQVVSLSLQLVTEAKKRQLSVPAIGLCIPGLVEPDSGLVWAPNIKGWKDFKLLPFLRKNLGRVITVVSDRTAYVEGEAWRGAARGKKNVIYLAVGTGIGAGLMVDGRVMHGQSDLAGAAGWLALKPEFKSNYKKTGCFEAEASGQAFWRKSKELIRRRPEILAFSRQTEPAAIKNPVEVVGQAARAGQPEAVRLVEEIQAYLAMGVANLVSLFNPEMIVLGGGLFKSADLFFEPVRRKYKVWAQPLAAKEVEIVVSSLGQEAALFGCARSALNLFNNQQLAGQGKKMEKEIKQKNNKARK